MAVSALEKAIGYSFKDKDLAREALTHRSYLNENPTWGVPHNERLEFLGDAVLELIVTEELMNRFPEDDEGRLTALRASLVNYQFMAQAAGTLGLEACIMLSRGESKDTGRAREVIMANAMEAVIGALYQDAGYAECKRLVKDCVMSGLHGIMQSAAYRDPKSTLQEMTQGTKKITPHYREIEKTGPEHHTLFKVGVYIGEAFVASGEGYSKQEAEADAAKKALEKLEK